MQAKKYYWMIILHINFLFLLQVNERPANHKPCEAEFLLRS